MTSTSNIEHRTPQIAIVVAVAENGVIGRDGDLPWRLPDDLKHFKALTGGHAVVMGRKTYESIGRPLPNRLNIVLTRSPSFVADGVTVADSLNRAIEIAAEHGHDKLFVIGGAVVYEAALPLADELHVTHVHATVPGDVKLTRIDPAIWHCVADQRHGSDDRHEFSFDICHYERR